MQVPEDGKTIPLLAPNIGQVYEVLRKRNPWLPPAEFVSATMPMSIDLAIGKIPVLRLEVFVELPDMVVGDEMHSWGPAPEEETPEVLPDKAPEEIQPEYKTDEVW